MANTNQTIDPKTLDPKNCVVVGCRLPWGLVIQLNGKQYELNGRNKASQAGLVLPYGSTLVDKDFANKWFAANKAWPPVESGAIFMAKDLAELDVAHQDVAGQATGFEGLNAEFPIGKGDETEIITPATEKD